MYNAQRLLLILCLLSVFTQKTRSFSQPPSSSGVVVQSGQMRFVVYGHRMLGIQTIFPSISQQKDNNPQKQPYLKEKDVRYWHEGGYLYIETDSLQVRYLEGSRPDPSQMTDSLLRITFFLGSRQVVWYPGKPDALNLRGALPTLQGLSGDDLAEKLPPGLLSRAGWSLVDHSSGGQIDWFLLAYGHDYKSALSDWHRLFPSSAGMSLPSRQVLGYWLRHDSLLTVGQRDTLLMELHESDIPFSILATDSLLFAHEADTLRLLTSAALDSIPFVSFSGDVWTRWSTLAWLVHYNAISANSGFSTQVHAIGGSLQIDEDDSELQVRWMQASVFMPIFLSILTPSPDIKRLPRLFAEGSSDVTDAFLQAIRLRYDLIPYLQRSWKDAVMKGINICRPLYYEWPEQNDAYRYEDEFLCGDSLLVCPVLAPAGADGRTLRAIWLPPGRWWDVCRKCYRQGPRIFSDSYLLGEIPYFRRED